MLCCSTLDPDYFNSDHERLGRASSVQLGLARLGVVVDEDKKIQAVLEDSRPGSAL
jgi:hypothetical protein